MTAAEPPVSQAPRACATGIGWRHPHNAELLEQQPALDFLEVHSENFFAPGGAARAVLRQGRERYPISLHGVGLSLGSAQGIDPWHLAQLAELVHDIEPVRVSDHACFARGVLPGGVALHASDLLPSPFTREALDTMCANVQRVQDRLRRPIAVENLSAYVQWRDAEMDEPTFLNTLAQRTGCQLLVDVNNIYVNALNDHLTDPLDRAPDNSARIVAFKPAWVRVYLRSSFATQQLTARIAARVLDGINPFNQRNTDLFNNPVSTDVGILTQAGKRWEGDVPLNLNNINDFGLIEIYETVLNRVKKQSLETGVTTDSVNSTLLLVAG